MIDATLSRAADGERITPDEAVALYREAPLEDLGAAADAVVRRRYGDQITYNVNAHLNPTNICVVGCGFCAFAVWTEKDERAYAYSVDQLVDRAVELSDLGITELHIVGGMTKEYDLPYYEELFRELKATLPHVSLTALTAVEVDFIARVSKVSHAEALRRLRAAGHDTMPGGGAEVFSARVRKIIADRKVPAEVWLAVHREAHAQGLRTNATLLFGHFETPEEQVDHMSRLRDLQDDTPYNSYTRAGLPPTPIAMVGRAALEAAVRPAKTDVLYFVATGKGDGRHYFSTSLVAHNANVARHLANLRGGSPLQVR